MFHLNFKTGFDTQRAIVLFNDYSLKKDQTHDYFTL